METHPRDGRRNILYLLERADRKIVGNYLFSQWRYYTHWAMGWDDYITDFLRRIISILESKYEAEKLKIVKVVIKGASGYGPCDDAYEDALIVSETGIQYLYKPMCPEIHRPRKWSYKTDRPEYAEYWSELCRLMPEILALGEDIILDGCETTFIVTYEDKSKAVKTFWAIYEESLISCFHLVRMMVPGGEDIPEVINVSENDEETE